MCKTCLYLYYSLQPTAYRYQVYISHTSYICLYPSNYNIRYLYLISNTKYTTMRTFIPMHTHIYTRANISTATGYPSVGTLTNIGFQYFKEFGLQHFTLEDFPDLVLAPLLRRLATDISSLSYSHTPILPHSWPSTSMAHYRQQHPVNYNAAQVARTKPSQYDRLSTMDNGTNTMFFVTVAWRQQ